MRGYLQCLVAFAAAAIIPVTALAQEQGLRNRDRERQLDASKRIAGDLQRASVHRGAFYLLSSIQLADIGYSEDTEFWAPTRDHTSGITFGINAPHRLYFIPRKKVIFALDAVPGYGFYRSKDVKGDEHFHAQFGYQTRAAMQLLLNHLYLETYAGKSDTLRSNTGELNRILTLDDRNYGLNAEYKYSSKTSALYSGGIRDIDYPDDAQQPEDLLVDLLGRREFSQRGSVTHKTFARTSLVVAAEASSYEFKRLESRDSRRTYGGGGVIYSGDRVSAGAEAGYAQLSFERPGAADFGGLLGNVRGDVAVGRRWSISGAASRDVDFSIFGENRYYIVDRANTAALYRATQRLSLRGAINVGRNKYDVLTSGVYRRDKLSFISLGFDYTIRRSRLGLEVGHYSRTSTIGDPPENGIRMTIHVSLRP